MALQTLPVGEVGLSRPPVLAALPVAVLVVGALVLRSGPDDEVGARIRRLLFGSRVLVVSLLVVAAAGPYTVATRETPGDPHVTLLVDESASMDVHEADLGELVREIEAAGVPVRRTVVASGNESRVGDALVASLEADGSVLLYSDGQVTGGRSLESAAEVARSLNATVYALDLSTPTVERHVRLAGPAKTSVGVENAFLATVDGLNLDNRSARLEVIVDGDTVLDRVVRGSDRVEFSHTFETTGEHRVVARVEGEDGVAANDVFYRTVRVVEQPRILHVARGSYPFEGVLRELYDVEAAERVPSDLSPYTAVVLQDVAAPDLGNVTELQRFVIEGNGLVAVGGENAYERGDYANSPLATLLPVSVGAGGGRSATVVLAIDVSGSTEGSMRVQKALALDVLDQLGDDTQVGVVAFNQRAYEVATPRPLSTGRAEIEELVRRLQSGGGTRIAFGLYGASEMLDYEGGNVILLTDGLDDSPDVVPAARQLGTQGTRVVAVGVGARVREGLLSRVASAAGGVYLRADETDRLRLLFGDESRQYAGNALAVVDSSHFVTTGVEPQANPARANDVSVKDGADYLVAAGSGRPAIAAWRFGLGRVVSVTAYGADGSLDGLLSAPDSLLLTRSVNWAIGDPERKSTGVVDLPDTRVGEPTEATFVGDARPSGADVAFTRAGERRYEATVVPTEAGFASLLDAEYAASYPEEFGAYGQSAALVQAVRATGGRTFDPDDARAIAETVRRRARQVREVRRTWDWLFLLVGLAVFLGEVTARRLQLYYGRGRLP